MSTPDPTADRSPDRQAGLEVGRRAEASTDRHAAGAADRHAAGAADRHAAGAAGPPLIDWSRTARRMRRVALVLAVAVMAGWVAYGVVGDGGFGLRMLGELTGFALLAVILAEVVVVGGAALTGMLRAGERGERLAGSDVSLVPPQLRRRR